ncbi:uncharacterized protein [Henckelia pumila]|uniref:uncharacterized protein isoform X2 n=1 Tax=Henckelia pumila TaxID=405737 RepID=UPI003C6E3C24
MSLHLQMRMGCAEEPSKGVLEGKWILSIEWIKACLNAKEFVEEQHYEITCDIHGIREGPKIGRLRLLNMAHGFPLKELLSKHNKIRGFRFSLEISSSKFNNFCSGCPNSIPKRVPDSLREGLSFDFTINRRQIENPDFETGRRKNKIWERADFDSLEELETKTRKV